MSKIFVGLIGDLKHQPKHEFRDRRTKVGTYDSYYPPDKCKKMRFRIFLNISSSLSSRNGAMRLMYTCWQQQQSDERDFLKNITAGFRTKIEGRSSEENKERRRARLDVPMTHSRRGKGWDDVMMDDKWHPCDSMLWRRAERSMSVICRWPGRYTAQTSNELNVATNFSHQASPTSYLHQWPPSVTCLLLAG